MCKKVTTGMDVATSVAHTAAVTACLLVTTFFS